RRGQADAGPDPAVPPDRVARGDRGPGRDRRRRGHHRRRPHRRPDRGGDGGADLGVGGRAGAHRHGQGHRPGRGDHRRAGRVEGRREDGAMAALTGTGAVIKALVITASNRAAAGVYPDRSGPVLADLAGTVGCPVDGPVVVPAGEPVEAALRSALADGYDVVVTTGGTGLTPGDLTPGLRRGVMERRVPGIAEALRAAGAAAGVPSAILSRGVAGVAGRTLIVNL